MIAVIHSPTPSVSPSTGQSGGASNLWLPAATLTAALIAAVVAGLSAFLQRKSGREVAAGVAERAEADARAKRYQDAATQLGNEKAAVRLAGVYAMARLADDWPKERQSCVDVLCAYLRMPELNPKDSASYLGDLQVRATILRLIASHVDQSMPNENTLPSWSDCEFDLSGATIRDLDWIHLTFNQRVNFAGAVFEGDCSINNCNFEWAGARFDRATVKGRLHLATIAAIECGVTFADARINAGGEMQIDVGWLGSTARWDLSQLAIHGVLRIDISPDAHREALSIPKATVSEGGKALITCNGHELKDKYTKKFGVPFLDFTQWTVTKGGEVQIDRQLFDIWSARWEPDKIDVDATVSLDISRLTL